MFLILKNIFQVTNIYNLLVNGLFTYSTIISLCILCVIWDRGYHCIQFYIVSIVIINPCINIFTMVLIIHIITRVFINVFGMQFFFTFNSHNFRSMVLIFGPLGKSSFFYIFVGFSSLFISLFLPIIHHGDMLLEFLLPIGRGRIDLSLE